ncbi:hypothetical protein ABW19_dt0205998 [Dactylella cylindrospora]|nr:hypothetical protein ABW19_dt0205998 [Dactylella cylindrospora]
MPKGRGRPFKKVYVVFELHLKHYNRGPNQVYYIENLIRQISGQNETLRIIVRRWGIGGVRVMITEMLALGYFNDRKRALKAFPALENEAKQKATQAEKMLKGAKRPGIPSTPSVPSSFSSDGDSDEDDEELMFKQYYERVAIALEGNQKIPPVTPIYLSGSNQYAILRQAEIFMERFCYSFFQKWLPRILQQRHIEDPTAVSLRYWAELWNENLSSFPTNAYPGNVHDKGQIREHVLQPLYNLHNAIETRDRIDDQQIVAGVANLGELAGALGDLVAAADMRGLEKNLNAMYTVIKNNRLQNREEFRKALTQIDSQRRKLDDAEKLALRTVYEKDQEFEATLVTGSHSRYRAVRN